MILRCRKGDLVSLPIEMSHGIWYNIFKLLRVGGAIEEYHPCEAKENDGKDNMRVVRGRWWV